jgi:hypothetical protein
MLSVAALAGDLAPALRNTDRESARKLFAVAQKADADGQRATAARLFERVVELDPSGAAARLKLGYRQSGADWQRAPAQEAEVKERADSDGARAEAARREADAIEDARVKEIVRLCTTRATMEERRPILLPLLERMPDRADVHEALGDVNVGGEWVPAELAPAAKLMPLRLQAWRNFSEDPVALQPSEFSLKLPGAEAPLAFQKADGCDVASLPGLGEAPAQAVARVRGFLRFLLGDKASIWTPPPLVFLGADPYQAMVKALHPDEKAFQLYHAYENYEHEDFYAIRVYDVANAAERYAHGAGYLTMYGLVANGDTAAHAWLLEGFGYLASLEVFDTGNISFSSIDETKAKRAGAQPPPAERTRAACLAWVRGEVKGGRGAPIADVCGRSLNDLDLCASLEAYSFVRFLFLYDPDAARKFALGLRDAKGDTQAARVDAALRASFGRGLDELERLWLAFPTG